ncbi:MAG TPA: class I SAM-dependent methyltransferase [Gemmatimonadales bacterium]|jgi:SAM-dependent methyltransferase
MPDARLEEEAAFADSEYAPMVGDVTINPGMFAKYERPRQLWDWRQRAAQSLGPVAGRRLLDFGSGQGEEACYFAKLGADVSAIDISPVGIQVGRDRAKANGLTVDFQVMSCAATTFADNTFDLVHGHGILHHVGLAEALTEVYRILKPGGRAVFLEPLGNSPRIEALKQRVYHRYKDRRHLIPLTSGEENLRLDDIGRATARWAMVRLYPYYLASRARKLFLPMKYWHLLYRFDHGVLQVMPPLKHFAGGAVIYLEK